MLRENSALYGNGHLFSPLPKSHTRSRRVIQQSEGSAAFCCGCCSELGLRRQGVRKQLHSKSLRDGKVHSCPVQELQCNFPLQLEPDGGSTAAVFDLIKEDAVSDVPLIKNALCACLTA